MIRDRLRRWTQHGHRALPAPFPDLARVRVYSAPWVLRGAGGLLRDGAVVMDLECGQVLDLGLQSEVGPRWRGASRIDLSGLLLPGLVNANAHIELTAIAEPAPAGLGVRRWIRKVADLRAQTDRLDERSREARLRASVRACLDCGTAAIGEVTHSLRPVPAMGREGLYGVVFHELVNARRMARALAAAAVQKAGIVPWPEGVRYRLAPGGLRATAKLALKELLIHPFGEGRTAAERAARTGRPVVLSPRVERQVAGSLPPLVSYLEAGCRIALGTDLSAGSTDLSVLREAAELAAAYPEVPALVLFEAATFGGATALGLETLGALTIGRAPGLLHVPVFGRTPDDPCRWLLRAGNPDLNWLVRAAPPPFAA